jgi:hypothetical protein
VIACLTYHFVMLRTPELKRVCIYEYTARCAVPSSKNGPGVACLIGYLVVWRHKLLTVVNQLVSLG